MIITQVVNESEAASCIVFCVGLRGHIITFLTLHRSLGQAWGRSQILARDSSLSALWLLKSEVLKVKKNFLLQISTTGHCKAMHLEGGMSGTLQRFHVELSSQTFLGATEQ